MRLSITGLDVHFPAFFGLFFSRSFSPRHSPPEDQEALFSGDRYAGLALGPELLRRIRRHDMAARCGRLVWLHGVAARCGCTVWLFTLQWTVPMGSDAILSSLQASR